MGGTTTQAGVPRRSPALAGRALLAVFSTVSVSACALDYVPARQRVSSVGATHIEPVALSIPVYARTVEVTLRFRAGEPTTIVKATLATEGEARCGGGKAAKSIEREGVGGRPVVRGVAEVVLGFDKSDFPDDVEDRPVRVDLSLELPTPPPGTSQRRDRRHCVSVPLVGTLAELEWEPADRFTFVERGGYVWYSSPLEGLENQVDISLGLGTWYQEVLFAAAIGVTGSICPESVCPPQTQVEGQPETDTRMAFGPSGSVDVGFWPLEYGHFSAGLTGRYWVSRTNALTHEGDRVFWTHGPRLVPKIGINEKDFLMPGVPAGARAAVIEIEAPQGINLSGRGASTLVYGVGVRIGVTVW